MVENMFLIPELSSFQNFESSGSWSGSENIVEWMSVWFTAVSSCTERCLLLSDKNFRLRRFRVLTIHNVSSFELNLNENIMVV